MTYYLAVVFALYFCVLITLMIGLNRVSRNLPEPEKTQEFISIVIAARNEQENITSLLSSIANLNYPREKFEAIVVNDHSEDNTLQMATDFFDINKIGRVVSLVEGSGKKPALAFGIDSAKGNIIVTTDADCLVPTEWLLRVNQIFQNPSMQMSVGGVKIISDGKIFSSLQSMEFASVIGTGAVSLGHGHPVMCNGANLSFRKNAFQRVNGYKDNLNYASGDDQFLMTKINQRFPNSVSFIPFSDSVVSTKPLSSLSDFFNQRIRWAGKWSALSALSRSLAVFIFLVQVSWIGLIVSGFTFLILPIVLIVVKVLLEFLFLYKISKFLSEPFQPISFLLLQFFYAPYVIATAVVSQFKTFKWKGRSYVG